MRVTMTLVEAVKEMRSAGFPTTAKSTADGIVSGRYPFGTLISTGETGRRRFEILRVDFERWLKEVTK